MGFLDKNSEVIDMILTAEGRRLLSEGDLDFTYYSFMDDEIDYNPFVSNSGSYSDADLKLFKTRQIEESPVGEALSGMFKGSNYLSKDTVNGQSFLFTMPQGSSVIPRMTVSPVGSGSIIVKQRKVQSVILKKASNGSIIEKIGPTDVGYEKFDSSNFAISLDVLDSFSPEKREGFLISIFKSGSDGLVQVDSKRDSSGIRTYSNDMSLFIDLAGSNKE